MKNITAILGIAGAAAAIWLVANNFQEPVSIEDKRVYLQNADGVFRPSPWSRMSDQEIKDSYSLMVDYVLKNLKPPAGLVERIRIISAKYNVFT